MGQRTIRGRGVEMETAYVLVKGGPFGLAQHGAILRANHTPRNGP